MEQRPLEFEEFARLYESVSATPEILNFDEFAIAVRAETPSSLRGTNRHVSVLLSISVGADGSVLSCKAIVPTLPPGVTAIGILRDEDGNELGAIPDNTTDPDCLAAAERAASVLRFKPAEKDGVPVDFPDLRIGVGFSGSP
jgi:hypothetical protein